METLKNIIKITLSDYNTLVANGSIVKNGVTYTYSPYDTIYITTNGYGDDYVELCGGGGYPLSSLAKQEDLNNVHSYVDSEKQGRQLKDNELQQQIDAIVDADDVSVVNTSHTAHSEQAYATSTSDTRGHWTVSIPGVTSLYDGLKIHVKLSTYWYGNGESYNTLNVNGLGAKMVWWRYNSRLTSHFDKNAEVTLTYRSDCGSYTPTATTGELTKGTAYTDGWMADYAYYTQNLEDLRYYYSRPYAGSTISAQHLCAFDEKGKLIMLTNETGSSTSFTPTTTAFRPEDIVCCVSNVTSGNQVGEGQIYNQRAACYTYYNFGPQTSVASTIYLIGNLSSDGLFTLGTSDWFNYVPTNTTSPLSAYFPEDIYVIRVGMSYGNSTLFTLFAHNDVYYFDGLSLVPVTGRALLAECDADGNVISSTYSKTTNIKNSTSTGGLDQLHDGGDTFDFTDKNPNATTYDSTLTGTLTKGASGNYASSFGGKSIASGKRAFAEGTLTIAQGAYSHAEGGDTVTLGEEAHAEGFMSTAVGQASHAEGHSTVAEAIYSHAEGDQTLASGNVSHAEGYLTKATHPYSHAEGMNTTASGDTAHAEGNLSTASGTDSHAEGYSSTASGATAHAEGANTVAGGTKAHAEGYATTAQGDHSHAEGSETKALGTASHAEGLSTQASNVYDHAEGMSTVASGTVSHAEGNATKALGADSHAEGKQTTANAASSHAEGFGSYAGGTYSHAEGYYTKTTNDAEHACGKYNISRNNATTGTIFSVGIGTGDTARKNAIDIGANGDTYIYGVGGYTGNNPGASSTISTVISGLNTNINKKIGTSDLVTTINGGTTSTYPPTANAVRAYVESAVSSSDSSSAAEPFIINEDLMDLINNCDNENILYTGWETDWAELHEAIWVGRQLVTRYLGGTDYMVTPVSYVIESMTYEGDDADETNYCVDFIWFYNTEVIRTAYIYIDNTGPTTSMYDITLNYNSQYILSKLTGNIATLSSVAISSKSSSSAVTGSEAWTKIYADYTTMTSGTSMSLYASSAHTVLVLPTSTTARTITLPSSPANGEMFVIRKMYTGSAAAVTVKSSNSSHSFQLSTSSTTYTYSTGYTISSSTYRPVRFLFYSNKWYIITDD